MFGYIRHGKIWRKAWRTFPDKQIGEVQNQDETATLHYFENRFSDLENKFLQLEEKITSTQNKGSFLVKLEHLLESLSIHDGIGDYEKLAKQIEAHIQQIKDVIKKNREKNTLIKQGLTEELQVAVAMVNWKEATEKITDIRNRWIKTGQVIDEKQEEIESTFKETITDFFERKNAFFEDKKRLGEHYTLLYKEIIEETREKFQKKGKISKEFADEQRAKWKMNGPVSSDIYKPLLEEFNNLLRPPRPKKLHIDLSEITEKLNQALASRLDFEKGEIESIQLQIRTALKNSKLADQAVDCQQLLLVWQEKQFVDSLCRKKRKDFDQLSLIEKNKLRIHFLYDLLSRDKEELNTIEQNHEKFNINSPKMQEMMLDKIKKYQGNIRIKERLLQNLRKKEV